MVLSAGLEEKGREEEEMKRGGGEGQRKKERAKPAPQGFVLSALSQAKSVSQCRKTPGQSLDP